MTEALHVAAQSPLRFDALKSLVKHGAPVNAKLQLTPDDGVFIAKISQDGPLTAQSIYYGKSSTDYFFGGFPHQGERKVEEILKFESLINTVLIFGLEILFPKFENRFF